MTREQKLRALAEPSHELTSNDKEYIKKLSAEFGLEFEPNAGCSNCWRDQAVLILVTMKGKDEEQEATKSERKYVLRSNVDVIWRGIRINEATVDDERAEMLLANGFPRKFFVKC